MRKLFPLMLLAVLVLAGCTKTTKCECTSVNNPKEIIIVNTDKGLPCKKITKVGYERLLEGQLVRDLEDVTCKEVKD